MGSLNQKRRLQIFSLVALLLLAQVTWWTFLFIRNVNENQTLQTKLGYSAEETTKEAFHKRLMFISESSFFLLLTGLGLFLLHRSQKFDEKSHEAQKNFIEILAHESKTPLTALKLRLESLLENETRENTKTELKAGIEEIRRLSSIVEKTLNLNRMERQELVKELVSVSDVLKDLVRRLDPFIKSNNAKVELNIECDSCVLGDLDGLRNSFQSIIENSIIYNDKEKKLLTIQVIEENQHICIHFKDNGPGISVLDREMVFEKFYRGKSRSKNSGTGLGLFIARTIVKAHHGVIRLIPESKGAHFEIILPATT